MDYVPHVSEIFLIASVIFVIFGLGRLPQMSVALAKGAGGEKRGEGFEKPDNDAQSEG